MTVSRVAPRQAAAFTIEGEEWKYDHLFNPCGPFSGGGTSNDGVSILWNPCVVGIGFDQSVANMADWEATAGQSAGEWYAYDSSRGHVVFNYLINAVGTGVVIEATDLGTPNAQGQVILGETPVSSLYDGSNERAIDGAAVEVNNNSGVIWCTYDETNCPSTSYVLQQTIVHELGHALGLTHPVTGPNMPYVMECVAVYLENEAVQSDDRNGQMWLYSGHPSDFGSPGAIPC